MPGSIPLPSSLSPIWGARVSPSLERIAPVVYGWRSRSKMPEDAGFRIRARRRSSPSSRCRDTSASRRRRRSPGRSISAISGWSLAASRGRSRCRFISRPVTTGCARATRMIGGRISAADHRRSKRPRNGRGSLSGESHHSTSIPLTSLTDQRSSKTRRRADATRRTSSSAAMRTPIRSTRRRAEKIVRRPATSC